RALEAGDRVQERRLARSVRADHAEDRPERELEVDAVDGLDADEVDRETPSPEGRTSGGRLGRALGRRSPDSPKARAGPVPPGALIPLTAVLAAALGSSPADETIAS